MFISYEYVNEDSRTVYGDLPELSVKYKISDDSFEKVVEVSAVLGDQTYYNIIEKVITLYESKNLPVATNLVRALLFFCKRNHLSLKYFISWNKGNTSNFAKYEKEIEKYLTLL